jgi:hypothetical protein
MRVTQDLSEWRSLYAAALFEDDRSKINTRVVEAELAMVSRSRALFSTSNSDRKEAIELDQSLRMLQLLKSCVATRPETQPAA